MNNFEIRFATEKDCPTILNFIKSLAIYEKLENEVKGDVEKLRQSLFVENEAEVVIGEENGVAVGFALFFFNFSTFESKKGLYLEDLFVEKQYRGKGYGKALLLHLANIALERKCRRMEWICLDWNTPSLDFYKSLGAVPMKGWTIQRLDYDALMRLRKK